MQGFHIRIRFRFLFVWNDAKISPWPPCVTITFGGSTPIIDKTDIVPNAFPTSSIILTVDKPLSIPFCFSYWHVSCSSALMKCQDKMRYDATAHAVKSPVFLSEVANSVRLQT